MPHYIRIGLVAALVLAELTACVAPEAALDQASMPKSSVAGKPATTVAKPPVADRKLVLTGDPRQGGAMQGLAPEGTRRLTLDGVEIPLDSERRFLIAFDRDAATTALLKAELVDGTVVERALSVKPGAWRIEHVNASPTANIPSAEFLARRKPELERIAAARAINSRSDGWRQNFRWPLTGRISGWFGSQRIYRGTPGNYHSGVDVSAPRGAAFVAPADGVIVLAAKKPFTLEGYLLIVDHGMGLNSAFLHCSSLVVKEGDVVKQGQTLGTVGATGRATGPHMHWGMKWRDVRLDPASLAGTMP